VSFSSRTLSVDGEAAFPGFRITGERVLADGNGNLLWIVNPPQRRSWASDEILTDVEPIDWRLEDRPGGAVVRVAGEGGEMDVVELSGAAATAFDSSASEEPMTVVPTFRALGSAADLSEHLVGGHVLTGGPRRKWPVDQTALSLYRIARLRGGAFWHGVADHIAEVTCTRAETAPDGRAASGHWGHGDVHVRFLADAVLLLVAHAEWRGGQRFRRAADRGADGLESFGTPYAGGRWYLHDSVEQSEGRNDLVLNTHVLALIALIAGGRGAAAGLRALESVLAARARGARAIAAGAALAAGDLSRAFAPRGIAGHAAKRVQPTVASVAAEARALRIRGGFVARDASGRPAPAHYLTVNLADLAALQRNAPAPLVASTLATGLRYARWSGYVRAELRGRAGPAVLVPAMLRCAGRDGAARRAAEAARRAGFAPAVGWPGYEDRLWGRLAPGTP